MSDTFYREQEASREGPGELTTEERKIVDRALWCSTKVIGHGPQIPLASVPSAPTIGIKTAKGPTILLNSGRYFDLLDPDGSEIVIEDIAHGLSNCCRFAGQCREFYSVAEHCGYVADTISPEYEYEGLMHDSTESLIHDITRPLKSILPDYRGHEDRIERSLARKYRLNPAATPAVKLADLRVLAAEKAQVINGAHDSWGLEEITPAPIAVRFLSPKQAKIEFLERFYRLIPKVFEVKALPTSRSDRLWRALSDSLWRALGVER